VANSVGGGQVDARLIEESLRRKAKGEKGIDLGKSAQRKDTTQYGTTPGQLGRMKGDGVDSIISSPPYASEITGSNDVRETAEKSRKKRKTKGGSLGQSQRSFGYGTGEGNISGLKEGDVDSVVASPPFEGSLNDGKVDDRWQGWSLNSDGSNRLAKSAGQNYSDNPENIGNSTGETFWTAARDIVSQCYQILKPGGVAVWVVKDFVRNKKIVPFCADWKKLCLACGFEFLHEHHAMLVKSRQKMTLGGPVTIEKKKCSFFRRLAEKKGSPKIDWEVVLCVKKPDR
jgi:hypothetical protein